jgi:ABC-type sugar transport system substrate-binding protein
VTTRPGRSLRNIVGFMALCTLFASACGSSDNGSDASQETTAPATTNTVTTAVGTMMTSGQPTTTGGSTPGTTAGGDPVADAKAAATALLDPASSAFDYSSAIPKDKVTPRAGARVAIVAGSLASPVTKSYADFVKSAANLAGYESTQFDGKFDVATQAQLIQQAVAEHYDGIVLVGVVPETVAAALETARADKVPVVAFDGYGDGDNGVTDVGVDPATVGRGVGQWLVADSGGTAKVLAFTFPTGASGGPKSVVQVAQVALLDVLRSCGGCSVVQKDITIGDVVAAGSPVYVAAINDLDKGKIDYVASGCDTCMVNFAKANSQLSRNELKVTGGYAVGPAGLAEIASGANNAVVAPVHPAEVIGLLAIDTLARRLAGQDVANVKMAAPLVVKDTAGMYPNANFSPTTDYRATFASLWSK